MMLFGKNVEDNYANMMQADPTPTDMHSKLAAARYTVSGYSRDRYQCPWFQCSNFLRTGRLDPGRG